MTDQPTLDRESDSNDDELTDPETLRNRDDVEYRERTVVQDEEHLELNEPIDGRIIVGLTDDDGRLLLSSPGCGDAWLLPYAPVQPNEDYAAVARRDLAERAGIDVVVAGVERVLRKEYRIEDDEVRRTTVHHVVVSASPADGDAIPHNPGPNETDNPGPDEADATDLRWFDDEPPVLPEGEPLDDLELFLD